ncbi:glycoside hydrolase family 3 N-terminal domain-containing protein [Demequina sp.]|uniref:glycoside hydrolase family 3 N-terminal domain-containing protein n=1 Tax=Demequina sp. TaxID=2050685 RepID=UPI0025CD309C|nr:glycoside hydrolase family 3 N-terminal domain-containing protein [Demequina sp.]
MDPASSPTSLQHAPYKNADLPVDVRVADLLDRMTLAEKVGQMLQLDARGDLDELVLNKRAGSLLHASPARVRRAYQLMRSTRLEIPLLMADDCIHGHSFWSGATIFPTQLGMAATWDPALVERGARAAAVEISATGIHWTFSPVLCISRDLRWGRVDETFGEDPHLIGELGAAMIRGYQGSGLEDATAVLATAKHFAGYSETQGGRDASEADLSRRKLQSWFLPPFKRAVDAGVATFMIGYQAIDGVPVTANKWLLNDVLKEAWGFKGTLVTDWDNVGRMVWEQRVCADDVEAAIVAVTAGNDLVMTTPQFFEAAQEAVRAGRLDAALIDAAVARILSLKFQLGLFEDARIPDKDRQAAVIGSAEHTAINLDVARRSLVLLRNDGTLPLATGQTDGRRRIAVVGPNADDPNAQLGDWAGASGQIDWMPDGHPRETVTTMLDGIRAIAPAGWIVDHARGAEIGHLEPDPAGTTFPDGQPRPPVFVAAERDPHAIAEARALAENADWVVAVVGDTVALTGEGRSTATLDLMGSQIAMLDALAETGTPMIVVLVQSKPSTLPESALQAAAIIQAFNPGMQGGRALAELLFGLVEPTGRLPITVARHAGQLPIFYNQVRGQHGDRYADMTQAPLFSFGEGLSYARVAYSDVALNADTFTRDDTLTASFTLTNTGQRPSLETVQLYVTDEVTSVTWAVRELKGFTQVLVPPRSTMEASISVPIADLTVVDAEGNRGVESGRFDIQIGKHSNDPEMLHAKFEVN